MNAVQDTYPDDVAWCYGCGRLNAHGLHVRTSWTGTAGVARFMPRPEHTAVPGFVYGGLLASLIDCHAIGTAAAVAMHAAGRIPGVDPAPRFVTAALEVRFFKPTPIDEELELTARPVDVSETKVIVKVTVTVDGVDTVLGHVVAVPMPASMRRD